MESLIGQVLYGLCLDSAQLREANLRVEGEGRAKAKVPLGEGAPPQGWRWRRPVLSRALHSVCSVRVAVWRSRGRPGEPSRAASQ